ncbi:hypothetical protein ACUXST_002546 [Sphingomonas sp. F9_3S_D5_B_2]
MSYREKSAWVMGALMLAAGLYYLHLALAASTAIGSTAPPLAIVIPFTVLVVVASVAAQATMAILRPGDAAAAADERERPLLDRAGNWSGFVLGVGAVTSALFFAYHQDGRLFFHMIMGSLIISQISEYGFQISLLRRSS